MRPSRRSGLGWLRFASVTALVGLFLVFGAQEAAAQCGGGGNRDYHFSGTLEVDNDGDTRDLEGVQLRIVRKGSPLKWAQGPDAVTNEDGEFDVTCSFARDRNGALARGKKIRFKIMARFRDDDLKIRKGGWAKNNWFEVADRRGCRRSRKKRPWPLKDIPACMDYRFDDIDKSFDTDSLAGKHAYLWWFYRHLQEELQERGVGLANRPFFTHQVAVTYPDRNIRSFFSKLFGNDPNSFFLFNIHLVPGDWNDHRTMIHEWMHRWDVGHAGGEAHITCLLDKHHKNADAKLISRCGGYMEGFAEATAQRLTQVLDEVPDTFIHEGEEHFYYVEPHTREEMRNQEGGFEYQLDSLEDAEKTDEGWENFLKLFWTHNEWRHSGGNPAWIDEDGCDPRDVSVFEMLQAIIAEAPRKGGIWKTKGNATFEWFTDVMERQIPDFDSTDGKLYRMMGNPVYTGKEIYDEVCAPDTRTAEQGLESSGDSGRAGESDQPGDVPGQPGQPGQVPREPIDPDAIPEDRLPGAGDLPVAAVAADFSGKWSTNFGELRLHQFRDFVIGDYAGQGIILGRVRGDCVAGVFTNEGRNGIFRFSTSGDSFEGEWAWHGEELGGSWSGTREAQSIEGVRNFTRDDSAVRIVDNERTVYDGTYGSNFGPVELISRDLFLVGDYGDRGIIAGVWEGNSFEGYFTNEGRTGWFDFAFLSRTGSFRDGSWGWVGQGESGDWTLGEQSASLPELSNITDDVSCR